MHTAMLTQFQLPADTSAQAYEALCNEVAPAFAEVPGLARKVFIYNAEDNTGGGMYLWQSRDAAEAFEPQLRDMLADMNLKPTITYFDAPVIVDSK